MKDSKVWKKARAVHGTEEMSIIWAGDKPPLLSPETHERPSTVNPTTDGGFEYSFAAWPSIDDFRERGSMNAVPLPPEMALFVGQIIVQCSAVEARVKSI